MLKLIILLNMTITMFACGNDKKMGKVSPELAGVDKPVTTNNTLRVDAGWSMFTANNDVTIASLIVPVSNMYLMNDESSAEIYSCGSDIAENCQVDLAAGPLTDILPQNSELEVVEGSYDSVNIYYSPNCEENSGWNVILDASGTLEGITYYTKADGTLSTEGPSEKYEMNFSLSCKGSPLPVAVEVKEGQSIKVRSFFDLQNLATIEKNRGIGGSCISDSENEVSICINAPDIAATVDSGKPTIERYLLSDDAYESEGCLGMVGIFVNSLDIPFGGYLRGAFHEGQDCGGGSMGGGGTISVRRNSDGSVDFHDGPDEFSDYTWNVYQNFQRADHSGQASIKIGPSLETKGYSANRL